MEIRAVTPGDAAAVSEVHRRAFGGETGKSHVVRRLRDAGEGVELVDLAPVGPPERGGRLGTSAHTPRLDGSA